MLKLLRKSKISRSKIWLCCCRYWKVQRSGQVDVDELMSSLQAHEQKNLKRNGNKAIKHAFQSKLFLKEDRYEYEGTLTNEYTI